MSSYLPTDLIVTISIPAIRWCPCGEPIMHPDGDLCDACVADLHHWEGDLDGDSRAVEDRDPDEYGYDILDEEWLSDQDYAHIKAQRTATDAQLAFIGKQVQIQRAYLALYTHPAHCACPDCLAGLDLIPF